VKRNITNLFEDVEDPFADDFEGTVGSPATHITGGTKLQKGRMQQKNGLKKSFLGGEDYYLEDQSQSITPTNEGGIAFPNPI